MLTIWTTGRSFPRIFDGPYIALMTHERAHLPTVAVSMRTIVESLKSKSLKKEVKGLYEVHEEDDIDRQLVWLIWRTSGLAGSHVCALHSRQDASIISQGHALLGPNGRLRA